MRTVCFPVYSSIIYSYDGVVVGKLPFQPIAFIRGILHGRLRGTDYTDLAMVCIMLSIVSCD